MQREKSEKGETRRKREKLKNSYILKECNTKKVQNEKCANEENMKS